MKKVLWFCALALAAQAGEARAEWPRMSPYLGVAAGGHVPARDWDLGNKLDKGVKPATSLVVDLRLGLQLFRQLAIEVNAGYLPMTPDGGDSTSVFALDLAVLYHLTAGKWAPFVEAGGGGYLNGAGGGLEGDEDPIVHAGVGLRGLLTKWMALRVMGRDLISDGSDGGGSHNLELTAGLDLFWVRGGKPAAPPPAPTSDRDGETESDDGSTCHDDAGVVALGGWPDQDGDGVADAEDRCPEVAGKLELGGCPDQDGDGVTDAEDSCPEVAGKPELAGCPDQDGDGVTDAEDRCPTEAGVATLGGCPDKDGDGVADAEDRCPDKPGLVEEQGCLPKEVEQFTGAIQGIFFKTGSAVIEKKSFKVLDKALAVLVKFQALRLRVEGHTDNVGKPEDNQALSQARAESVRTYFVGKGIAEGRLEAAGYGDSRPKADNATKKGKAQNRRIEFTVLGQQ
ncbi:MAG: OmpA family protein [Deltaproteobacteria bacterium]|nr:OmpA family protein [Deltaproteobacteria bacterium]